MKTYRYTNGKGQKVIILDYSEDEEFIAELDRVARYDQRVQKWMKILGPVFVFVQIATLAVCRWLDT